MSGWWERWQRRQCELTQGVDADLVRDNRRRYKLALGLLAFGLSLIFLNAESIYRMHCASLSLVWPWCRG
jgi:hypothetical protein